MEDRDIHGNEAVGWSRNAQEAAKARQGPQADASFSSRSETSFRDRRIGYVTGRWVIVLIGAVLGGSVNLLIGLGRGVSYGDIGVDALLPLAGAGIGALIALMFVLLFLRRKPPDEQRPWRSRLADWIALR